MVLGFHAPPCPQARGVTCNYSTQIKGSMQVCGSSTGGRPVHMWRLWPSPPRSAPLLYGAS